MALIECTECTKQVSDKAASCPNCGAPVNTSNTTKEVIATVAQKEIANKHSGAETVYYTDANGVKITNARFIVSNSTYPLQGITSIKTVVVPKSMTPAILLIVIGVIMCIAGQVPLGLVIVLLGIVYIFAVKDQHAVKISTSAQETNALISKDKEYIDKVASALNEAFIHRG